MKLANFSESIKRCSHTQNEQEWAIEFEYASILFGIKVQVPIFTFGSEIGIMWFQEGYTSRQFSLLKYNYQENNFQSILELSSLSSEYRHEENKNWKNSKELQLTKVLISWSFISYEGRVALIYTDVQIITIIITTISIIIANPLRV